MAPRSAKRRRTDSRKSAAPPLSTLLALKGEGSGRGLDSPTTKAALVTVLNKAKVEAVSKDVVGKLLKDLRETILKAEKDDMVTWENVDAWFVQGSDMYLRDKRLNVSAGCEELVVVGSWLLKLGGRGDGGVEVDIAAKMPVKIFGKRDFGGARYWWKRALWLGWLAKVVGKGKDWENIRIGEDCMAGHAYQPFLAMTSKKEPLVRVRLLPWIPDVDESILLTNSSLRADAMIVAHLSLLHKAAEMCPDFSDAVILLKRWARRRRLYNSSFGTTSILTQQLLSGKIPKATKLDHLVRATLATIAALHGTWASQTLPGTVSPGKAVLDRWALEAKMVLTGNDCVSYFCNPRGFSLTPAPIATLFDAFIAVSLGHGGTMEMCSAELDNALVKTGRVRSIVPFSVTPSLGCFGLFLDLIDASRRVDTCQSEDDKESFKKFWRDKSELRRFKNKGIKEAVVWSEGKEVISQILEYLAKSRSWIDKVSCTFSQACKAAKTESDPGFGTASMAFSELNDLLRKCEDIPLRMSSLQSSSPYLRRTAVSTPRPLSTSRFIEPIELILTFESSSAWPLDATAIAASKAAFYCSLSSALKKQGVKSTPAISFLDVSLSGLYFRIRLRVPAEVTVLEKTPAQRLQHVTEVAPAIHDRLRVISNPSFAPAARLSKRWLASQLLLDAMGTDPELLVDVLVAYGYMSSLCQPGSPMAGFAKFLATLAEFPWETEPLIVTLATDDEEAHGGLSEEELRSKVTNLVQGEKAEGMQVIVLGDYEAALCSHGNGPELVITRRLRASAVAALKWLNGAISTLQVPMPQSLSKNPEFRTLFVADYSAYDVVITLAKKYVSRGKGMQGKGRALVGFDTVATFVEGLRRELGNYCLFLFNRYGGNKICIVWRPEEEHKFSLSRVAYSEIVEPDGNLSRDRGAILRSIRRIGGDVVQDVETTH